MCVYLRELDLDLPSCSIQFRSSGARPRPTVASQDREARSCRSKLHALDDLSAHRKKAGPKRLWARHTKDRALIVRECSPVENDPYWLTALATCEPGNPLGAA